MTKVGRSISLELVIGCLIINPIDWSIFEFVEDHLNANIKFENIIKKDIYGRH